MIPALFFAAVLSASPVTPVNIIDGSDERGSLLAIGPSLGLSDAEIARIRAVSGHVVCTGGETVTASGALFLTDNQILTAGHTFFNSAGRRRAQCYFRPQRVGSDWIALDLAKARFGASLPRPGSNADWAVVRLTKPIVGAVPFPPAPKPPVKGEALIVVTAQPAGFESLDPNVPVVQPCAVRRVPVSSAATSFYRSDCDAGGGSSGGMNLTRIDGALFFRGVTISSGPWRDTNLTGAPYNEKKGSVTTALGTDAAILAAAQELAGE